MQKKKKYQTIIIICEGHSERAYLQEFNKFLRDEMECYYHFAPHPANGGDYRSVIRKYNEVKKANPRSKTPFYIWVDYDIYKNRNGKNYKEYSANKDKNPDFLFSKMNFEDTLVLHLEKDCIIQWETICHRHNHFDVPLVASTYKDLFNRFISSILIVGYQKGEIPFEITEEKIQNIFSNVMEGSFTIQSELHKMLYKYLKDWFSI